MEFPDVLEFGKSGEIVKENKMKSFCFESLEERTLLAVTAGIEAAFAAPQPTSASLIVTTLDDVTDSSDGVVSLN